MRDESGDTVAGAEIGMGNSYSDFDHCSTQSRPDGTYRLHGITASREGKTVWARVGEGAMAKRVRAPVELDSGRETVCEPATSPRPSCVPATSLTSGICA